MTSSHSRDIVHKVLLQGLTHLSRGQQRVCLAMASGSAGNGGPGQADMVTQVERVRGGVQMSLCMTHNKERYITFATLHVGI